MEIIIENVTSASEITVTEPHIALFSSIFAPIISAGIVGMIGYLTIRFYQKSHKRDALLDVFESFNEVHKKYEEDLFRLYRNNNLYERGKIPIGLEDIVKNITRKYDEIGLLFNRGLIPKTDYCEMYGRITVAVHRILFEAINNERIAGRKHHLIYFTKLAIACYEYWNKKENIPRDPKTNQDISKTSLQAWKDSLEGKGGATI